MSATMLTLKQARYKCFRKQTELAGGAVAEPDPEFYAKVEAHPLFRASRGWQSFGLLWDLEFQGPDNLTLVGRNESLWALWQEHCEAVAKSVPKSEAPVEHLVREVFQQELTVEARLVKD